MNLNRAMIIGNLTRDPETRTTPSGQMVSNFSVATSSQWTDAQGKKQERVEYHSIVAWGKLAEICSQYLTKGKKIYIEGRLQTRDWEAQDGTKKQKTEIVAEHMIMLDRAGSAPAAASSSVASSQAQPVIDKGMGEEEIRLEDIPF